MMMLIFLEMEIRLQYLQHNRLDLDGDNDDIRHCWNGRTTMCHSVEGGLDCYVPGLDQLYYVPEEVIIIEKYI